MNEPVDMGGPGMDRTATLLRARCIDEFGRVTPDVAALVDGGLRAGRRLRRRRQLAAGSIVAGVVVAASAAGYTAVDRGWFAEDATGPANPRVEQLVPATGRGMAAAVVAHLPDGYELVTGGMGEGIPGKSGGGVLVGISKDPAAALQVMAAPDLEMWNEIDADGCDSGFSCDFFTTTEGYDAVSVTGEENDLSFTGAAVKRTADVVIAMYTTERPEPGLSVDDLVELATDPLVGLQTSSSMNERGTLLDGWTDDFPAAGYLLMESETGTSVEMAPGGNAGGHATGGSGAAPVTPPVTPSEKSQVAPQETGGR